MKGRQHHGAIHEPMKQREGAMASGRRKWTDDEVAILTACVKEQQQSDETHRSVGINWALVSAQLPGRNPKQCRFRWLNQTTDDTKLGGWEHVEEMVMTSVHCTQGPTWAAIARMLCKRTELSVKNRWNSAYRSMTLYQPYSILWHYTQQLRQGVSPAAAFKAACSSWKQVVPEQLAVAVMEEFQAWQESQTDGAERHTFDGPSTTHSLKPTTPMGVTMASTLGHSMPYQSQVTKPRPVKLENTDCQESKESSHSQGKLQPVAADPSTPSLQHVMSPICCPAPTPALAGCSAQSSPTCLGAMSSGQQVQYAQQLPDCMPYGFQQGQLVAYNGQMFTVIPNMGGMEGFTAPAGAHVMACPTQHMAPVMVLMSGAAGASWPMVSHGMMAPGQHLVIPPGFAGW